MKDKTKKLSWNERLDKASGWADKIEYVILIIRYVANSIRNFPRYRSGADSEESGAGPGDESESADKQMEESSGVPGSSEPSRNG